MDSDFITLFSFTVCPLFSEFFMSVLYIRIISPEYAVFIKINTSIFGMLFENDPVCYVHVSSDSQWFHISHALNFYFKVFIFQNLLGFFLYYC